ncbi:MAG: DUF6364 family protein [Methanobrevibacter sp.]|jgi:hypothetical protein|nr:DUF6364 family protein [Candidatus Methanovirga australis]
MKTKNRLRTTLNLDKDVIKTIKVVALNKNSTQTEIINEYLRKGLEAEKDKNKIPDYLIANKTTYNPDPDRIMKSSGFIKGVEPFDAVKLVKEMRRGG